VAQFDGANPGLANMFWGDEIGFADSQRNHIWHGVNDIEKFANARRLDFAHPFCKYFAFEYIHQYVSFLV